MGATGDSAAGDLEAAVDDREQSQLHLLELERRARREEVTAEELVHETLDELRRSIAQRQVAEEELRAQRDELATAYDAMVGERQRYRDLFERAPVGYVVTDPSGLIRDSNRSAARLLGH
jgi:PAS domain-containing protein